MHLLLLQYDPNNNFKLGGTMKSQGQPQNPARWAQKQRPFPRCCVPVDVVPIPAVHSHSTHGRPNTTSVDANTREVVTALPGNTPASVLQAVAASDRTLRRQKGSLSLMLRRQRQQHW